MRVGVRELRDGLSRYLAEVQRGEEVVVTDHGRPVVRMSAYGAAGSLESLVAAGLITMPPVAKADLADPIDAGAAVSDLIAEQRR